MNTEQEIDDEVCAIMMGYGNLDGHELLTALVVRRVAAERERCARAPTTHPERATINDAPAFLNTNDRAMWVLGFNEALDRIADMKAPT